MFTAVERSQFPGSEVGCVCVVGVFRTRQWLSPVGADCMRQAPRVGRVMPANLSDFIIGRSGAGKILNICLSHLDRVRSRPPFPSSAGCLYNPSERNV